MAWQARTMEDVATLIYEAEKRYGAAGWRPVGDRENNIGTIRIASDPALAMVERVTNSMDAMLELGRAVNVGKDPATPGEAARAWCGVPAGGIAAMTGDERRSLGKHIRLTLEESGEGKRPTVVADDDGIGQHPSLFPRTLVSLNEKNKVRKPWTLGTYGQGGSTTLGFSRAVIIVSRAHPATLAGKPDSIGWTIVREEDTDPSVDIMPSYKYLVTGSNEVPEAGPGALPELSYGTRCIHIAYDVPAWSAPFTTELWQFMHAALFDPVLPFLIGSNRERDKKYGDRIVIGNAVRLQQPDKARGDLEVAHRDSATIDLGKTYGSVTARYWVVRRPIGSDKSSEAAAGYTKADTAIATTLFGQRQDTEHRAWIKDNAKLPFLYKNIIVQLDADHLTPIAKRELFSTTRERGTKSQLRSTLLDELCAIFNSDAELSRLNHEEKERLLQKSTAVTNDKIRKRLGKFIKTKLRNLTKPVTIGTGSGTGAKKPQPKPQPPHPPSPPRNTNDSALHKVPTKLHIVSKKVRLYRGAKAYTWVEVDAKNGYLPQHDDDLKLSWGAAGPGSKARIVSRSELLGGKTRWLFEADDDSPTGSFTFIAELSTANGLVTDTTSVMIADKPPAPPSKNGTDPETGPDVRWVIKDQWDDHKVGDEDRKMDGKDVGYVTEDADATIIWVNRHLDILDKALSASKLTPEAVTTRADRYQFPIACGLWLQHDAEKRTQQKPTDSYRREELLRMAEAVLTAMDPDIDLALEESDTR